MWAAAGLPDCVDSTFFIYMSRYLYNYLCTLYVFFDSVSLSVILYGVRSRRTRLLEDQLGRADAGSWQIADGSTVAMAADHRTSVGDFRVRFVVEL